MDRSLQRGLADPAGEETSERSRTNDCRNVNPVRRPGRFFIGDNESRGTLRRQRRLPLNPRPNTSLRLPRCVSTGPVVVRLAGMANERERERPNTSVPTWSSSALT